MLAVAALAVAVTVMAAVSNRNAAEAPVGRWSLSVETLERWTLPSRLREISALAKTDDGRLLAVDDERAIIYELDLAGQRIASAFAVGEPALRGDFEGLAVAGGKLWLMDSSGDLYRAQLGANGDRVNAEKLRTPLDGECEFEGLATSRDGKRLLLLCKEVRKRSDIDTLSIFTWDIENESLVPEERQALPVAAIADALGSDDLHPSGLAVDPETGHRFVVAARERALIEMDAGGRFVIARELPLPDWHRQAEGIEITADGRLVIADEGGKGKARLGVYRNAPSRP